jgi:hypothetical protein
MSLRYGFSTVGERGKVQSCTTWRMCFYANLWGVMGVGEDLAKRGLIVLLSFYQTHTPGILNGLSAIFKLKPFDDLTHVVLYSSLG